jgi:hypothetical protein
MSGTVQMRPFSSHRQQIVSKFSRQNQWPYATLPPRMRLGAQTGTPPGVCEKSAVNLRQAAFYRHSIGRNAYPAADPVSFVFSLLLMVREKFSPFFTYLHLFTPTFPKMMYENGQKETLRRNNAVDFWGARPPRAQFGAPPRRTRGVGSSQTVVPYQARSIRLGHEIPKEISDNT